MEQMSQALYINLKKDKAQVFISVLCKCSEYRARVHNKTEVTVCDMNDIK